jgi:hypothetical protein
LGKKIRVGEMYTVKKGQFKGNRFRVTDRKGNVLYLEGNNIRIAIRITR